MAEVAIKAPTFHPRPITIAHNDVTITEVTIPRMVLVGPNTAWPSIKATPASSGHPHVLPNTFLARTGVPLAITNRASTSINKETCIV